MRLAANRDAGWIKRPEGIVALEICKLGGGLATEGCRRAMTFNEAGELVESSLIGVEYFRRGTQPAEECPIHGMAPGDR
jgi:hypothetical protein